MNGTLLHIAERSDWERAHDTGAYRPGSLDTDGFIHLSRPDQVVWVADSFYRDRTDLVLLVVDPGRLTAALKVEDGFPHLYGPLETDAVTRILEFQPKVDGTFELPAGIEE